MFHIVHILYNDEHRNYHIYRNNKKFLTPKIKISRRKAQRICAILNGE
jgi:hypothetical protein